MDRTRYQGACVINRLPPFRLSVGPCMFVPGKDSLKVVASAKWSASRVRSDVQTRVANNRMGIRKESAEHPVWREPRYSHCEYLWCTPEKVLNSWDTQPGATSSITRYGVRNGQHRAFDASGQCSSGCLLDTSSVGIHQNGLDCPCAWVLRPWHFLVVRPMHAIYTHSVHHLCPPQHASYVGLHAADIILLLSLNFHYSSHDESSLLILFEAIVNNGFLHSSVTPGLKHRSLYSINNTGLKLSSPHLINSNSLKYSSIYLIKSNSFLLLN